jgi:hypothetical protein
MKPLFALDFEGTLSDNGNTAKTVYEEETPVSIKKTANVLFLILIESDMIV